ncbi:MAG: fumarylacetoacetate hydrolase family protein [Gammaproteobacteria bacterium]|nr:fumarylacetoacetate hydrolase family protein [Gammaproteobacteria bacterium]MDH3447947.1 fumarylacetoacetate hydrolase family protein [Gammaproteobacteria bacterium]
MTKYIIEPAPQASLPIRGSDTRFPVRRVYCVGRNYAAHTIEMGGDPDREEPFFFQKNPDNLLSDGADFPYPDKSADVHHEIEMIVALKKGGYNIPLESALDCVWGYGVALDMTRRDLQGECKKAGRPWEIGKAFDHSAPASELVPVSESGHPSQGAIWLKVNSEIRQQGDLNQMIWKVPEMIAYLSSLFALAPGDVILSGTPSGVGPVERGDLLEGHIDGVGDLKCKVV